MVIHELNTKALTSPAYIALDDGEDTYKVDFSIIKSALDGQISSIEEAAETAEETATAKTRIFYGELASTGSAVACADFAPTINGYDFIVVKSATARTAGTFTVGNYPQGYVYANGSRRNIHFAAGECLLFRVVDVTQFEPQPVVQYHYIGKIYPEATTSESGLMSAEDKAALDQATEDIANLKSDLNKVVEISTTLRDGYINSATGDPVAPTTDAQKYSDLFSVDYGSKISVSVTLSAARYRVIYICAYNSDNEFISRVKINEGGAYTNLTIEYTVDNANIAYCRFGFNGYGLMTSYNVYVTKSVDNAITEATEPIETEIGIIKDLDNICFQYLDSSAWESGYYNWNSTQTGLVKNAGGTSWYCLKVNGIPAGTYNYNKFCSLPFSFIEYTSTGSISKLADIGITETTNGTVTIANDFNLWLSINTTYFDKTITMFAGGNMPSSYTYGYYKDTAAANYVNAQGQEIFIVGEGYYSTIQAACDAASANDIIFIRCGTYTEQVSIWNKKLHLIGENKTNTILIDHSGNYNTPPLEMSLGSLSNMTIIEDGSSPTGDSTSSYYNTAYCLHIEWEPDDADEVFRIDNCDFINYVHAPLGCGLYQDYTVHFTNCTFRCEATNEGNMERGSFYFHTRNAENCTGQKIIAENCIISSAGTKWAVLLGVPSGANNTGSAEARFSNCCIWNDNDGTANSVAYFDTSGGADVLKVVNSYGNTVAVLNN